jgi:hypothetical protein
LILIVPVLVPRELKLADTGRGFGTSTEVVLHRSRDVAGYPASLLLVEVAQGSTGEQAHHRAVHPLLVEAVHHSREVAGYPASLLVVEVAQGSRKVVQAHLISTSEKYNQRYVRSVFHRLHHLIKI